MTAIEENLSHEISELICLKCFHRWIGVYPERTCLKDLVCKCGSVGYVIKTGQTLPEVDDVEMENDKRYQNMVKKYGREKAKQKYIDYCSRGLL